MQDDDLRVDVSHVDGVTQVTVRGDIDANTAIALRSTLDQLSLEKQIRVDMAGVAFMDSSGLKLLLIQQMRMTESGGTVYICNPSAAVVRLLTVAGVSEVLLDVA